MTWRIDFQSSFFKLGHSPDSDQLQVMASAYIFTSTQCLLGPGSAFTPISHPPQQLCRLSYKRNSWGSEFMWFV